MVVSGRSSHLIDPELVPLREKFPQLTRTAEALPEIRPRRPGRR
jgi:hypothetical protein